ncbi:MAG: hypothetical protein COA79_22585 [Planctomycetota bacterium]|nr:MAG: hypothetical protein COA79_22585 [Planctomycetota bacterium]
MILLITNKKSYSELSNEILSLNIPIWFGSKILHQEELEDLRNNGLNVTNFNYKIDDHSEINLDRALQTIKEHHPGDIIHVNKLSAN